ncbi:MAG: hypothetical protein WCB63_01050 [Polyangiales bacterium]
MVASLVIGFSVRQLGIEHVGGTPFLMNGVRPEPSTFLAVLDART